MDMGDLILFEVESPDRCAKSEDTSLRITSPPESRSHTEVPREWSESWPFGKLTQDDEPHGVLEDDPIRWEVSRWVDVFQRKPSASRHIPPSNPPDPPTSITSITRLDPPPNRPPNPSTTLQGSEASPLIPRQYQLQIYERALNENTIVVMDTGSGKTLVAAMLIKEMRRREVEANRALVNRKLSFFVVSNVPLVKQQADAIRRDSSVEVIEICGASKTKKHQESVWTEVAESAQVVVITAQILLDALRQGYWHMSRIDLLVFDECHHAHKSHPYCFIMNKFYHITASGAKTDKPRIFGMTASPTTDVELERTMDCKLYTIEPQVLQDYVERPVQVVALYNPPPRYNRTLLSWRMRNTCYFDPKLLQVWNDANVILAHLGPWCVDQIWRLAIKNLLAASKSTAAATNHLEVAKAVIAESVSMPPELQSESLTPKVQKLIQTLRVTGKMLGDKFCGIIFVQRRDTAVALTILLQEYRPFRDMFRVQVLAGHSEGHHLLLNMTPKDQSIIINKFRDKDYNLIVSTNVAEEGLDIQPCNVVIRFDPVNTTTSYIQSRGRARKKDSRYIMLQECSNHQEEAMLAKLQRGEQNMREWCNNLENNRTDTTLDIIEIPKTRKSTSYEQQYLVASTQALITLSSAIPLVYRFCNVLSGDAYCEWRPIFELRRSGMSGYYCDLILPIHAPIRIFQSDRASCKDTARMSAAFRACETLHRMGALDDHLEPVVPRTVAKKEKEKEISVKLFRAEQNHDYPHNTPVFWTNSLFQDQNRSRQVFMCSITLMDGASRDHGYRTSCFITSKPLPFESHLFNVYINGEVRQMILRTSPTPLQLKKNQFSLLQQYTLTLLRRISRKQFEYSGGIPFLVAPIDQNPAGSTVAWHEVELGQTLDPQPIVSKRLSNAAIKELVMKVTNDRFRDYFVHEVLREHALDEVMPKRFKAEIDAMRNNKGNRFLEPTFRQYFLWKFKTECTDSDDNTMVLLRQVKRLRNSLQPMIHGAAEQEDRASTLAPLSICQRSTISASVLRMSLLIPSTLFDLDALLLAQEVQQQLHLHAVALDSLQVALTTSSANRDYNYERLELLGDSFLKFSITIRLYIVNPANTEGELHMHRIRVISNTALLSHCLQLEFFRRITSAPFHRKDWRPCQFLVDHTPWDDERVHTLSNKTLADIVEAILGAAFLSGGHEVAFNAAKHLGIPFDEFEGWADMHRVQSQMMTMTDKQVEHDQRRNNAALRHSGLYNQIKTLEARIGYTFKNKNLVHQAMTHASAAAKDSGQCYERLEFLGDAVLDFQVIRYYYTKYHDAPPGAITLIKDASVNNQILGAMAVQLGLGEFLIHNSAALAGEIERAIVAIETIKEGSPKGVLEGEYWVDIKMPKVLGDLVESTIGAVFVDCGFDFTEISALFARFIRPFLDKHVNLDSIVIHPTKALLEFLQSKGCNDSRFNREEPTVAGGSGGGSGAHSTLRRLGLGHGHRVGPTLECRFLVHGSLMASAKGTNMEELRKEVAVETMHRLKNEPELLELLCTCPRKRQAGQATMLDRYQGEHYGTGA
ncbi:Dicer-like protein 1 [Podila verticillata]|nr:Dicer-like protein 1 [Podila verticillata]